MHHALIEHFAYVLSLLRNDFYLGLVNSIVVSTRVLPQQSIRYCRCPITFILSQMVADLSIIDSVHS